MGIKFIQVQTQSGCTNRMGVQSERCKNRMFANSGVKNKMGIKFIQVQTQCKIKMGVHVLSKWV